MLRRRHSFGFTGACLALMFVTVGASAQLTSPVIVKTAQRWTPPLAGHESRIEFCPAGGGAAAVSSQVVLDDWVCPQSGPIIRVGWWGEVSVPEQAYREYYIAIYLDNGNCEPGDLLYTACVTPRAKVVGHNCNGTRVWRFTAPLPNPFTQTEGEHYWLQISENDELSVEPGVAEFRWSAHRPIEKCRAVLIDAAGTTISPLINSCDDREDDLAFALWSRTISGSISFPGLLVNPILRLELYDPATGFLVASKPLEPYPAAGVPRVGGADSFFDIWTEIEVPDGSYDYQIVGMGMSPVRGQLMLEQGMETRLPAVQAEMGDLNGDCHRDILDLLQLLADWGQCMPM